MITACDKAASFVINVRQMQVRDAAKRARLQLKGGERQRNQHAQRCIPAVQGQQRLVKKHNVFVLERQDETVCHTAQHGELCIKQQLSSTAATSNNNSLPLHLSNIVSISDVPNSDSLEREFGWNSSAATTCTRCCNKMHIDCLMAGRRPRNLAYLHSPSLRGGTCAGVNSFSHKLWMIRCSFSRS